MGFNNRAATPLLFASSPLLPQADSSEDHNIPTAVSPTTAKIQDWIAGLATLASSYFASSEDWLAVDGVTTWLSPASGTLTFLAPDATVDTVEVDVTDCLVGDVLLITVNASMKIEHPSGGLPMCFIRASIEEDVGGAGSVSSLPCRAAFPAVDTGTVFYGGASLVTKATVAAAGDARVFVLGAVPSGDTTQMHMLCWSITVVRIRA
jgi:hypothetical protein